MSHSSLDELLSPTQPPAPSGTNPAARRPSPPSPTERGGEGDHEATGRETESPSPDPSSTRAFRYDVVNGRMEGFLGLSQAIQTTARDLGQYRPAQIARAVAGSRHQFRLRLLLELTEIRRPRRSTLAKIADELGVPVEDLDAVLDQWLEAAGDAIAPEPGGAT